jgi:predicted dehydrogenase
LKRGLKRGVGVVGLGMASLPHAKSLLDLSDRVDVRGVYSPSADRRTQFSQKFGFPAVDSVEAIATDEHIDAVLLLTPPNARADIVDILAAHGKHILMEKPIERTLASAEQLVVQCEQQGVKLGLVFQHRFRDASMALREQLETGKLGRVHAVQISVPWWRDQSYYDVPGRGSYARDGGGVLISQAIHTLDLAISLVGPVQSVTACGCVGSLMATTASFPGATESIVLHAEQATASLVGGELNINFHSGETLHVGESSGSGGGSDPMDFPHDWHKRLISNFLDSLDDGGEVGVSGREGLQVHRLIDALERANEAGRHIMVG